MTTERAKDPSTEMPLQESGWQIRLFKAAEQLLEIAGDLGKEYPLISVKIIELANEIMNDRSALKNKILHQCGVKVDVKGKHMYAMLIEAVKTLEMLSTLDGKKEFVNKNGEPLPNQEELILSLKESAKKFIIETVSNE